MKSSKKGLNIAPGILRGLREQNGYSGKEIAKRLDISPVELEKIEKNEKPITSTYVKKLSKIYDCPLVIFFEEELPIYPHTMKDYRINRNKKITPEVKKAERRAYYLINALSEISEEKSSIPEFNNKDTAYQIVKAFREKIKIEKPTVNKAEEALDSYKSQLEKEMGIIIIEYPLKAEDVRAFSITSDISIIVLNEADKPEIKIFSLFHELCHLIQKSSAVCSISNEEESDEYLRNEYFCNEFASEMLVPSVEIKDSETSQEAINKLRKKYFVSKQVIMIKLRKKGLITNDQYETFKRSFNKDNASKNKFGRRNWEKAYLKRLGNKTIETVRKAYKSDKISKAEVLNILDIKNRYAEKFIE